MAKSWGRGDLGSFLDVGGGYICCGAVECGCKRGPPMTQNITLGDALGNIVDEIMGTHGIESRKHPELRQIMYQVAACTASLMVKHFNREEVEHERAIDSPKPWVKGSNNVH